MIGKKKVHVLDRHEHGGLPDPIELSQHLYEIRVGDDGHVTMTCHCPRCEAERERKRMNAAANFKEWGGYITDCLQDLKGTEAAKQFRKEMKAARAMMRPVPK